MSGTLRIKNWSEHQHYKQRNPPWIKLYRALLDDRAYQMLEDAPARLLIDLWLLASKQNDGTLVFDSAEIAWALRRSVESIRSSLQVLIRTKFIEADGHDASTALALRLHDAMPEERREETEEMYPTVVPPTWKSRLLDEVPNREAWAGEIAMAVDGARGPAFKITAAQVEDACREYLGNGVTNGKHNLKHFRGYLRRAARPDGDRSPSGRGGTGQRSYDNAVQAMKELGEAI